jgi:hypothetical protein
MTRRRWIIIACLMLVLLTGGLLWIRSRDLRARSHKIQPGMTRTDVEAEFGEPRLELNRSSRPGKLLSWVDQMWQLDILIDGENRVESVSIKPSDSPFRRTVGKVIVLPK